MTNDRQNNATDEQGQTAEEKKSIAKKRRRKIDDLTVSIARDLEEKGQRPKTQIKRIIKLLGEDFAKEILARVREVEANGGMLTFKGDRRRTPGGVFFHLAREAMPVEAKYQIFDRWHAKRVYLQEKQSDYEPFDWENRKNLLDQSQANKGEVIDMEVILKGRPEVIGRYENLVILSMADQINPNITWPVGVPNPPDIPVQYTLYVGALQWKKVGEMLDKFKTDEVIAEGQMAYDAETESMAVYVLRLTTRKLKREENKQQKGKGKKNSPATPAPKDDAPAATPTAESTAKPEKTTKKKSKPQRPMPEPVGLPDIEVTVPDGMNDADSQKFIELTKAAEMFRQKIATIQAKPADQQFGLEMTQKLLDNTQRQINALQRKYQ